jgi:hypothetical protein
VEPTENIQRHFAAEVAHFELSKKRFDVFVNTLRLWRMAGDPDRDNEQEAAFDTEDVQMWRICPLASDEETASGEPGEKPTDPQQLREWLMSTSYDASVKKFNVFYCSAWSCDAMFTLIKADMPSTVKVCQLWVDAEAKGEALDLGPLALSAKEAVSDFCKAYLAVCGGDVLTKSAHDCFLKVFMPSKASKHPDFWKYLALTARKHPQFKPLESELVRCAAQEIHASEPLAKLKMDFDDGEIPLATALEHIDKLFGWVQENAIRTSVTDPLIATTRNWLFAQTESILEDGPISSSQGSAKGADDTTQEDLTKCKAYQIICSNILQPPSRIHSEF